MSKSIESQVWRSALDCELKPLAAVMGDMGNDDGLGIYPSVAYLAWLLGRSERAVQRQLQKLVDVGILSRISGARGGRGRTPRYGLDVAALPKRPTWQETRKGDTMPPFIKGVTNDRKGDISDIKGDTMTPDPLVLDPLVDPKAYMPGTASPKEKTDPAHSTSNGNGSGNGSAGAKFPVPHGFCPDGVTLREMTATLNFDRGEADERVKQWRHSRTQLRPRLFTSTDQMLGDLAGYLSKCSTSKRKSI